MQPYGSPRGNRNRFFSVFDESGAKTDCTDEDTAITLLGATPKEGFVPEAEGGPRDPEYARAAFTPNFPAYPSGHAPFGGACFQTVRNFRAKTRRRPNDVRVRIVSGELNGSTGDNYAPWEDRDYEPMNFRRLVQPNVEEVDGLEHRTIKRTHIRRP